MFGLFNKNQVVEYEPFNFDRVLFYLAILAVGSYLGYKTLKFAFELARGGQEYDMEIDQEIPMGP